MKTFIIFSVLLLYSHVNYSQINFDSTLNRYLAAESAYTKLNYSFLGMEEKFWSNEPLYYFDNADSVKNFTKNKNLSGVSSLETINFDTSALILVSYHGVDCHSKFNIKLFDSPVNKEYIFTVKVIYGRCRAGGMYYTWWARIPRLPEGYKMNYKSYSVDEVRE